jgi:Protein of unknown function (DUF3800)
MYILFLDESGQLEQKGLFALGGIAVQERDWPILRRLWQEAQSAHRWPLDREIKWHGIRTGAVPPAVADGIFDALSAAPITCYVVLLDLALGPKVFPADQHEYFRTAEDSYATALMFLAERFQHLLADRDDLGIIVIDSRFREKDSRLRRFFSDLQEEGTPYMRLDRIVEGLFLGPSQYSVGLQCADLVVASSAAAERGVGDGRRYFTQMLPLFAVHPVTGKRNGVGVKRFPEEADRSARTETRLF